MLGTQPDTDSVLQAIDQISFEEGRGTETGKDSGVYSSLADFCIEFSTQPLSGN